MRVAIISFTEHGAVLAGNIDRELKLRGISCEAWVKKKKAERPFPTNVQVLEKSLAEWTEEQFAVRDVLLFIGAAGIAVRSIAPWIRSKKTDPAVVVLDERGRHAISLLSGHIGGANAMTLLVAEIVGAEAVITTATDLNKKFAVDSFAAARDLYMDSMEAAKGIAAELVAGKKVGMRSAFPIFGKVPQELELGSDTQAGFSIDVRRNSPFPETLYLVPRVLVLGIGCRRGTESGKIEKVVLETLEEHGIFRESVERIVSIDLKKNETGLLALAERMGVPFETYTADELQKVEMEGEFSESDFVKSVTGIGNVCERAALLGAGTGKLLIPKTAREGVTVAAAVGDYTVCMED